MRLSKLVTVISVALGCAMAWAQSDITVYTYNDRPPFIIDKAKKDGLEYRLCTWLTKQSGQFRFTLKVVTAENAKAMVAKNELDGVLIGVSPNWFSEEVRKQWLWTPPVLWDKNVVVSLGSAKVEYLGPASLEGHSFAGVKGFFYPGIMDAFKVGKIKRIDSDSELNSIRMVADRKADVTVVSEWTMLYVQLRMAVDGDFYQSDKAFQEFDRRILMPASMKALHEHLSKILSDVKQNSGWQEATSL
jgi:polar amino acid transport system substrate-binding protein